MASHIWYPLGGVVSSVYNLQPTHQVNMNRFNSVARDKPESYKTLAAYETDHFHFFNTYERNSDAKDVAE